MRSRSSGVDDRRRRLLDDLLVAALQRALALAEVDDRAVRVGEHLHLDVPRALEVALDEHAVVAERGLRLAPRGVERVGSSSRVGAHDAHALAAAARDRLDDDREAVLGANARSSSTPTSSPSSPGTTGTPASRASTFARALSPMSSIASGGGPTHTSPASTTARANAAFSLEEAVAGMDRLRRRPPRGVERPRRRRGTTRRARATSAASTCRRAGVDVGEHRDGAQPERVHACARPARAISPRLAIEDGVAHHARCQSIGPGDERVGAERPAEELLRARARRATQRVEVDAGLDAHLVQHRDEVLGRDVAGRARGHRAAAELAEATTRTSGSRPRSAAKHVREPLAARVVEVRGELDVGAELRARRLEERARPAPGSPSRSCRRTRSPTRPASTQPRARSTTRARAATRALVGAAERDRDDALGAQPASRARGR